MTTPIEIPQSRMRRSHPNKIHTINTTSHLSKSSPAFSFLSSPPPMSAPVSNSPFKTNVGRSRSSSRSGGVVFNTRPRAASEAARTAMEAMIQTRLDIITKRLDRFNTQSQEIQIQTEQLAKSFQEKAKRLYKVEDHLLRVQGKPGLSEAYLEDGPRRRRLTNDLDELSMGVRTLRRKFQAASTAVSAINWLSNLKDSGEQGSALTDKNTDLAATDHGLESTALHPSSSPALGAFGKKEGQVLQYILTAQELFSNDSSSEDAAALPSSGLNSPPLTPRGPLFGSSLLSKGLEDHHYSHTHKSRPLSIIPDLEDLAESLEQLSSAIQESTNTEASSVQHNNVRDTDEEPRPEFMQVFSPPSPASPTTRTTTGISTTATTSGLTEPTMQWPARAETGGAFAFSEPTTGTDAEKAAVAQRREQQEHEEQHELADTSRNRQQTQQHQQRSDNNDANESEQLDADTSKEEAKNGTSLQEDQAAATAAPKHPEPILSSSTAATTEILDQQQRSIQDGPSSTENDGTPEDKTDGWVQALWRLLVRAEYFLLGTAVLGAMMPDNLIALCAGFLSATMYGILVVRHRLTASPGKDAPHPPNAASIAAGHKKRVADAVGSRSKGTASTRRAKN
ncbi:hypothetical protein BC939DRAFT_450267 [Gamsiella multidivaricata]|uniref:uncharacterized protein n=1 Tax=Gamsiella multidivaricata TaxID=101098 RepID=UPI00221EDBFC|nr:uncharacterized protein BC939DRAFT_450267 [Gamsiella multidivaricata]KAG0365774.1 hypothetical protein BGZ54_006220 [Gamsiella multidivaricata]KAI7824404.1 hypothetical protein BC939DRAFT_450267 [Gamsiella multidivaricata]